MEEELPIWRVAVTILNKQLHTANKECGPPAWGLGKVPNPHCKNWPCYEMDTTVLVQGT